MFSVSNFRKQTNLIKIEDQRVTLQGHNVESDSKMPVLKETKDKNML